MQCRISVAIYGAREEKNPMISKENIECFKGKVKQTYERDFLFLLLKSNLQFFGVLIYSK